MAAVLDETQIIGIQAVGEALAQVEAITVTNVTTGIAYNVYQRGLAGETASATPGDQILVTVTLTNTGVVDGTLYASLYELIAGTTWSLIGGPLNLYGVAVGTSVSTDMGPFTMPTHDWDLKVEAGHYPP